MTELSPMLAAKYDAKKQKFPCLSSVKIDGFRCIARHGRALTRSLKEHTNRHLKQLFSENAEALEGMDGELVIGPPHNVYTKHEINGEEVTETDDVFERTSGPLRRFDGKPEFSFYVFDLVLPGYTFEERYAELCRRALNAPSWVHVVEQKEIESVAAVEEEHDAAVKNGYEGIMLRSFDGHYKFGRATTNEGILNKVKKRVDNEARIVGFVEERQNNNVAVIDETGHLKRSSHAANKVGKGTLGAFVGVVVNGPQKGEFFTCGSGFTASQRKSFWEHRDSLLGTFFTFEHLLIGAKVAPRHPVFKRLRPDWDMDKEDTK